jgi:Uma2 family endonuclease
MHDIEGPNHENCNTFSTGALQGYLSQQMTARKNLTIRVYQRVEPQRIRIEFDSRRRVTVVGRNHRRHVVVALR